MWVKEHEGIEGNIEMNTLVRQSDEARKKEFRKYPSWKPKVSLKPWFHKQYMTETIGNRLRLGLGQLWILDKMQCEF